LLFTSCLYIRNAWLIGIFSAAGALIHEAYLFFIPFLALNNILILYGGRWLGISRLIKASLPVFASPLLAVFALRIFRAPDPNRTFYESLMHEKIGLAADQHPLWSGFFEIFSTHSENAQSIGKIIVDLPGNIAYAVISPGIRV